MSNLIKKITDLPVCSDKESVSGLIGLDNDNNIKLISPKVINDSVAVEWRPVQFNKTEDTKATILKSELIELHEIGGILHVYFQYTSNYTLFTHDFQFNMGTLYNPDGLELDEGVELVARHNTMTYIDDVPAVIVIKAKLLIEVAYANATLTIEALKDGESFILETTGGIFNVIFEPLNNFNIANLTQTDEGGNA